MSFRCVVLSTVLVALVADAAEAGTVECPRIISAMSKSSRTGEAADISEIAKKLRTSVAWAEHCMRIYGRRARRPGLESAEGREGKLEKLEDYEPEEPLESEDRGELMLPRDHSKQQRYGKRPTPTGWEDVE